MSYHSQFLRWLFNILKKTARDGKDVEKPDPCTQEVRRQKAQLLWKTIRRFLKKIRNKTTIWSSYPPSVYIFRKNWNQVFIMPCALSSSQQHYSNRQDVKTTKVSPDGWVDRKNVYTHACIHTHGYTHTCIYSHTHTYTHAHNGILLTLKKRTLRYLTTWTNFEDLMLSNINHSQDRHSMVSLTWVF